MNRNSAVIWMPVVEKSGFPYPKTIMIPYDHNLMVQLLDGPVANESARKAFGDLVSASSFARNSISSKCFIRTDLASAKHSGPSGYLVAEEQDIPSRLMETIEDNEMKFWVDPKGGPTHIMVREFLDLDAPFTAFRGLPIAREWRLFAGENHVICFHPYWPEPALEEYVKGPANWRDLLADTHSIPDCINDLKKAAMFIAKRCVGRWSVDFAMDKSGQYWLIDCATMEDSWHWPGCEFSGNPLLEG